MAANRSSWFFSLERTPQSGVSSKVLERNWDQIMIRDIIAER